jgi:DNA-binding LacI/PurR family transcriptional regulator
LTAVVHLGDGALPRRPTIRDVAAAAGVSKSLVSLVFRDAQGVSPERRRRVLEAAENLDFRLNWIARSLAADDGNFVGILVADLHNPLFAEIVDAARLELARAGQYGLMTSALLPHHDGHPRLDDRILDAFGDLHACGILVVGSVPDMAALSKMSSNVPIVVASAVADNLPSASTVRSDDVVGMQLVIDHLVGRGHRRIAHIGGEGGLVSLERARAYEAAMRAHGLDQHIQIGPSDYTEEAGYRAARAVLSADPAPTAITAVNDLAAIGALAAASDSGLAVSGDLAVTGYDNTFLSAIRRISLTSVDPGNAEIGTQAARWLLRHVGERPAGPEEHLVQPSLMVRDSSDHSPSRSI